MSAALNRDNRGYRINLRSLFFYCVCVAVGCTIAAAPAAEPDSVLASYGYTVAQLNWHFAFLGTASAIIVMGLIREARGIGNAYPRFSALGRSYRFGAWWAVAWRIAVASLLIICMALQMAITRGFLEATDEEDLWFYGDILSSHVWWFCLIIVLTAAINGYRSPTVNNRSAKFAGVLACLGGIVVATFLLVNLSMIFGLVHFACAGVDASLPIKESRYGLRTLDQGFRFAALGVVGAAAVGAAAFGIVTALRCRPDQKRLRAITGIAGGVMLLGAASYGWWFYAIGFPAASPDMAEAGVRHSRYLLWGGLLLAVAGITVGAFRLASGDLGKVSPESCALRHLTGLNAGPIACCLMIAAAIYVEEQLRSSSSTGFFGTSVPEILAYMLVDPNMYFQFAIAILGTQLAWRRWRTGSQSASVKIWPLEPSRFAIAWVALAALTVVTIPTLAAASFSFWLGPWHQW